MTDEERKETVEKLRDAGASLIRADTQLEIPLEGLFDNMYDEQRCGIRAAHRLVEMSLLNQWQEFEVNANDLGNLVFYIADIIDKAS